MPAQPASVSLHPVASRNGQQSATYVSIQVGADRAAAGAAEPPQHNHVLVSSSSPQDDAESAAIATVKAAQQPPAAAEASSAGPQRPTLHRSPHSSGPGGPMQHGTVDCKDAAPSATWHSTSRTELDGDGDTRMSTASASSDPIDETVPGGMAAHMPHLASEASVDAIMPGRFAARAMPEAPVWGLQHPDLSEYPVIETAQAPTPDSTPAGWRALSDGSAAANHRKRATSAASAPPAALEAFWSGETGASPESVSDGSRPLRKISAGQFFDMFDRYAVCDTPHAVVFPFLHGVDGDNFDQNIFFGAPLSGMPTPRYRGLTIVRANMPTAQQKSLLSHKSAPLGQKGRPRMRSTGSAGRSRTDSVATDASEGSASLGSDSSAKHMTGRGPMPISTVSSSHSICSHTTSIFSHRSGAGNASVGSMTSFGSNANCDDGFFSDMSMQGGRHDGIPTAAGGHYEPQPAHSLLNSTVFPGELLSVPTGPRISASKRDSLQNQRSNPRRATFLKPRQADGVSLRNFKIQCAKYATISDIVIYCPAGLHEGMIELGNWFREAQDAKWEERQAKGLGGLRYNVFLIEDPFETFEARYPELVAVDSFGNSANRIDFADREREEMQELSKASEIDTNIWLGSAGDVPDTDCSQQMRSSGEAFASDPSQETDAANPHGFAVCIEAHEHGEMPTAARLANASAYLDSVSASLAQATERGGTDEDLAGRGRHILSLGPRGWTPPLRKLSSRARERLGGKSPIAQQMSLGPIARHLVPPTDSLVLLPCSTYRDTHQFDASQEDQLAQQMIELAEWCKTQAEPTADHGKTSTRGHAPSPRRILIYCGDGYTETSVLALTYIMLSRRMSLPEAYLHLQNVARRSFFVYSRELPFLKKVEALIRARDASLSPDSGAPAISTRGLDLRTNASWSADSTLELSAEPSIRHAQVRVLSGEDGEMSDDDVEPQNPSERQSWSRSLVVAASGLVSAIPTSSHRRQASGDNKATSGARGKTPTPASPQIKPAELALSHAEQYAWFYDPRFEGSFPSRILDFLYLGNLNHAMNAGMLHALGITHVVSVGETALFPPGASHAIDATGRGSARPNSLFLEEKEGRIQVLDLKDVSDDGIDPLRPTMKQAVEFIEGCRRSGGKALVHCRVGVSRSSTIVLAYCMAHLDLSLVESYLLVRSRRLNILIQPHLLFMFNLRSWEVYIARQRALRDASGKDEGLDVDLAAGSEAFRQGSGLKYFGPCTALRLTWGFLAREITHLNDKYFVS